MARSRKKSNRHGAAESPIKETRTDVAGIDIGSKEIFVSCLPPQGEDRNVRKFGADSQSLAELADWLREEKVVSVVMESTGVYWIPLYQVLNARGIEVLLVDARAVCGVPGHKKTDVLDCQWLRKLHASGLLKGCFLPDDTTAQLRTLQRTRRTLHQEQDDWVRRMQKNLDQMNVRVHRAVSDLTGQTGMRMLRAILAGERDPVALAKLRDPHCRLKEEEIARELAGVWRKELIFTLQVEMDAYDFLAKQIAKVDNEIIRRLQQLREDREKDGMPTALPPPPHPDKNKQERILKCGQEPLRQELTKTFGIDLTQIEGFGVEAAACVFTEIGPNVAQKFPTEEQFVSWLRLAPHLSISGGHPVRGKKKKHAGAHPLKKLLLTAAISQRQRDTPLGEQYRRIAYRKGAGVASFAVANKIARRLWRALAKGIEWATDYTHWQRTRDQQLLVRTQHAAAKLGMTLTPNTAPAS